MKIIRRTAVAKLAAAIILSSALGSPSAFSEPVRPAGDSAIGAYRIGPAPAVSGGTNCTAGIDCVREWVEADFDISGISAYTLGKHWERADRDQRKAFNDALVNHVSATVMGLLGTGEFSIEPTGRVKQLGDLTQIAAVLRTETAEVPLGLVLRGGHGSEKIFDVLLAGASMIKAKRAEFRSTLEREGGIVGLIAMLEAPANR